MKKYIACLLFFCCSIYSHASEISRVPLGKKTEKTSPSEVEKGPRKKERAVAKCVSSKLTNQFYSGELTQRPWYYINNVGSRGRTLITHDETVWEISGNHSFKTCRWCPGSPVVITPNYSWFSSYDYILKNQETGEFAEADLSQGPLIEYALFIQYVDPYQGYLQLTNGSHWYTDISARLLTWKTGQAILIGENDAWFGRKNILININENNFVTATAY